MPGHHLRFDTTIVGWMQGGIPDRPDHPPGPDARLGVIHRPGHVHQQPAPPAPAVRRRGAGTRLRRAVSFDVLEDDIVGACVRDSGRCAIADALRRSFPGVRNVLVDLQSIRFTVDGERRTYWTPRAAQDYLVAFDAGELVEPTTINLRTPVHVTAAGRRAKGPSSSRRTSTGLVRVGGNTMPRVGGQRAVRGFGLRTYPDSQVPTERP